MKLTALECKRVAAREKAYKLSDGGGLHLLVQPSGAKIWRLAYRFGDKSRTLTFGPFPQVGLAEARTQRDAAKEKLRQGIDPGAAVAASDSTTFEAVARQWFAKWKVGKHQGSINRTWNAFERDIIPELGSKAIHTITPREVLTALQRIESRGAIEIAHRTRQKISRIFRFAIALEITDRDPAALIGDAIQASPRTEHYSSLREDELPAFLRELSKYPEQRSVLALRLVLLTWVRTTELRFARWEEFEDLDGEAPLWRIPAGRMKMHREHLVPLSPAALSVLNRIGRKTTGLLFAADTRTGVISENTMLYALYRMGYKGRLTTHGLRGTASTISNEHGWNYDWVERQLAHVEENKIRGAYNAAEYMKGRREMLNWWADLVAEAERKGVAADEFAELM